MIDNESKEMKEILLILNYYYMIVTYKII